MSKTWEQMTIDEKAEDQAAMHRPGVRPHRP